MSSELLEFSIGDIVTVRIGKSRFAPGIVKKIKYDRHAFRREHTSSPLDICVKLEWLYSDSERKLIHRGKVIESGVPDPSAFFLSNHSQKRIPLSSIERKVQKDEIHIAGEVLFGVQAQEKSVQKSRLKNDPESSLERRSRRVKFES